MKKYIKRIKFKSEKGFTLQDVIAAFIVILIFIGIIATLMVYVYKTNMQTSLTSQMTLYAVQILEDIDKISYEEAQEKTGEYYKDKFSIPDGFDVQLQFTDYGEDTEDLIKIVDLKLTYTFQGETTEYNLQKLKIKEL